MAITRTQQNKDKLVSVSRDDVFSNDCEHLEQRAQFSVTGFSCYYELYYHNQWNRPILMCIPHNMMSTESTFFKVDVEDITIGEVVRLLLSKATGGAVTDFEALEICEPWLSQVDAENYKEELVKEAPIAQFTVIMTLRSFVDMIFIP